MNACIHQQIRKDLRVALPFLVLFLGWHLVWAFDWATAWTWKMPDSRLSSLLRMVESDRISVSLTLLAVFVPAVFLEDRLRDPKAFWLTRPPSAYDILRAKLLLTLTAGAVVPALLTFVAHVVSAGISAVAVDCALRTFAVHLAAILFFAAAAWLASSWMLYGVALTAATLVRFLTADGNRFPVESIAVPLAGIALAIGSLAALPALSRSPWQRTVPIAAAVVLAGVLLLRQATPGWLEPDPASLAEALHRADDNSAAIPLSESPYPPLIRAGLRLRIDSVHQVDDSLRVDYRIWLPRFRDADILGGRFVLTDRSDGRTWSLGRMRGTDLGRRFDSGTFSGMNTSTNVYAPGSPSPPPDPENGTLTWFPASPEDVGILNGRGD